MYTKHPHYFLKDIMLHIKLKETRAAADGSPSQTPVFFTFELYLVIKVTQKYPTSYEHAMFEVATLTFRRYIYKKIHSITKTLAQYPHII